MSSSIEIRKTRSNNLEGSNLLDELPTKLHSLIEFQNLYNQIYQIKTLRSLLIDNLCNLLTNSINFDTNLLVFILDCLIKNHEYLTDIQFKQNILPFIKSILSTNNNDNIILILKFLIEFIEYKSNILTPILSEWLSIILNFIITNLNSSTYLIYGDLIINLLKKIVQYFTPLPKEIVDILGRSPSSIISTNFLLQLKTWVKNLDDIKLALFAINLWQPLASLLSRLLTRGHTKGNEMLAIIQDAFIVANYSIRSAAFSAWGLFMTHIYQLNHDDIYQQQQLYNRLLKLFLTPFLPDYTSKSKSASIAKCRAWFVLVSAYPKHIDDVILPFFSFAFGNHKLGINEWWNECKKIGSQCLYDLLMNNINGEILIKNGREQILNYLFDSIIDEVLDGTINDENEYWLKSWNSCLIYLINIFQKNNLINNEQRMEINMCFLTRIEQLWIDSRIPTEILLKLFEKFEQTNFPLAIETVLKDSSTRTKTLSSTQNNQSQDQSSTIRTTLSDQYLHILLEHSIRFNNNSTIEDDSYLHIISYLIDTLSKTSDDNFCSQTNFLLVKCSDEFINQPLRISSLFWHIWLRCSTYLINILNRTQSIELNYQRKELTIDLLLRPLSFNDNKYLDYSYTLIWIQLFKALSRLIILNDKHLIYLYNNLLENKLIFEQLINDNKNQRLFGFLLNIIKYLLKTLIDLDLTNITKRLLTIILFIYTQLSNIINLILKRLLLLINNDNLQQWINISYCLIKSNNKISTNEQLKLYVFNYIRDLIIDLFTICKTCSQFEIILKNLTELISYLNSYEQLINIDLLTNKQQQQQQIDNIILNKIIGTIHIVFDTTNALSLLQIIYPYLILAFQHNKTIIRNKMKKCWNETFGRLTFLVYPNELRLCLRDLKEKEHLLLPCFLADHDNSNLTGSGLLPNSTDESQLSQQIDIVTPLINSIKSSPARISSPSLSVVHSTNIEKSEPIFVPITNNINHDNSSDSPVIINKRMSSTTTALTEKQKEKLRTRQAIPILCDDNSNAHSLSCTMDTPTMESMMAAYQLRSTNTEGNKSSINTVIQSSQESNTPEESSSSSPPPSAAVTSSTATENDNLSEQIIENNSNNEDDIPEESSIAKKLRRSRRSSTSARKSLANNARKKRSIPSTDEVPIITTTTTTTTTITSAPSDVMESSSSPNIEIIKTRPLKSILKRLSPTKPRQDHTRHVAFHDQVKVLLFASPLRRDSNSQLQKKKSPIREEAKASPTTTIITRRSSALHNNNNNTPPLELTVDNKSPSSSKLLNLSELSLNSKDPEPIFPALIDCDKPLDSLIHVVYGGACPTNAINYFHSIKMNTVGDIARSTTSQIDTYPIPPPKLANIQKALSLYQERLVNSPSLSPIIGESITPIASTSEETIAITDGTFTKEGSSLPTIINDPQNSMYDVDTLIDSLDYERLYLNDDKIVPSSTSQIDFIRTRRQIALANCDEEISPQKRRLSIVNQDNEELKTEEDNSPKKQTISNITLGERLQKATEIYQTTGRLSFDDNYIELVRQLFNNPSLTHLEQLHLKSLFLDN